MKGYYYLHENGSLIWKQYLDGGQVADFRESSLVRHFWQMDLDDRAEAWSLLVEASALGVERSRIDGLIALWGCNDIDAAVYAEQIGIRLYRDGDAWCATKRDFVDLQESPAGVGPTCLEAMADLCKQLGFKAQKMWGHTFVDLVAAT